MPRAEPAEAGFRPANLGAYFLHFRAAASAAADEAGELWHSRDTFGSDLRDTRHRSCASVDLRRAETIEPETSGRIRRVPVADFVFGVAAISADGFESLISTYVSPIRQDPEVKIIK